MKKGIAALIMLILIFLFFAFFYIKKVDVSLINGYASTKSITTISSNLRLSKNNTVKLIEIKDTDNIYKNGLNYYIGDKKKKTIYLEVPVYETDDSRIWNYSRKDYVSKEFIEANDLKNIIVADKNIYNAINNDNIDLYDYLFVILGNGLYMNNIEIEIQNINNNIVIPIYSIIYFNDKYINYYEKKDDELIYKTLPYITLEQKIKIGDLELTYEELLTKLGLYERKKETIYVEPTPKENNITHTKKDKNKNNQNPKTEIVEIDYQDLDKDYKKPEVTFDEFVASVYTAKGNLEIIDPESRIINAPTFIFYIDGVVYLRKTFSDPGEIKVTGLLPNTTYTVEGTYIYVNSNGSKVKKSFYEGTFKTKGPENLNQVGLDYSIDEIYSNRAVLNNLNITNDENDEIYDGIGRIEVVLDDKIFNVSANDVKKLINHESIDYSTNESLNSNTDYHGKIIIYDIANNPLKAINDTFDAKTCKQLPEAKINLIDTNLTGFIINVALKNKDDVNLNNYRYEVYDINGHSVYSGTLENKPNNEVKVSGLRDNQIYKVVVYTDVDLNDGNGTIRNIKLDEIQISTQPINTLGSLKLNLREQEITNDSAEFSFEINMKSTDSKIIQLLDSIEITITDNGNVVKTVIINKEEVTQLTASEIVNKVFNSLKSNTEYELSFVAKIKEGNQTFDVNVTSNITSFKTMKAPAYAKIENQFSNDSMIDFDVRVIDEDGVILSDRALIEIHDEHGKFIYSNILEINGESIRVTLNNLDKETDYIIDVIAESYNEGFTNRTYKTNYRLEGSKIIRTAMGIYGSISLENLLNVVKSENIINIENIDNFRLDGDSTIKRINVDKNNKVITFSASNAYANYSYYLPEYKNTKVLVKFKARYKSDSNRQDAYLTTGASKEIKGNTYLLDLTYEYKDYSIELIPDNGYLGFGVNEESGKNNITTIEVKDLQVIPYLKYDNDLTEDASKYDSKHYFTDAVMLSGKDEMTTPDGSKSIGHVGDGYARIKDLSNDKIYNYEYTGEVQEFVVPTTGEYYIELWGSSGGDKYDGQEPTASVIGGRGAYTSGIIKLEKNETLYVVVGERGKYYKTGTVPGGFNGGGDAGSFADGGSGGGATDIRLVSGVLEENSLKSRIMVAGAGGGSGQAQDTCFDDCLHFNIGNGGAAGGLFSEGAETASILHSKFGAGQLPYQLKDFEGNVIQQTRLGIGESGKERSNNGGGGGGYYGGLSSNYTTYTDGGAGGSSYISGYLGCISIRYANSLNAQNSDYTLYSEESFYKGNFNISLIDETDSSQLINNGYYIQILEDNREVLLEKETVSADFINKVIQKKTYKFDKGHSYTINLQIKNNDRYYTIDSVSFYTDNQIRTIHNKYELLNISSNSNYLVANDIDLTKMTYNIINEFNGNIDFQGHKLYFAASSYENTLFNQIGKGGTIKNVVIESNVDNFNKEFSPLTYYNYGLIDNVYLTIKTNENVIFHNLCGLVKLNDGTISNFVVNNENEINVSSTLGLISCDNKGLIKNGYLYGSLINGNNNSGSDNYKKIGSVTASQNADGAIENVFSLIDVVGYNNSVFPKQKYVGSLIGLGTSGTINNSYSVSVNDNIMRPIDNDANVVVDGSINSSKTYYISPSTYNDTVSKKSNKVSLWSKDFQNIVLNKDNAFLVDDYVEYGYYPHIKLDKTMPNQEYIPLPELVNDDLLNIINSEVTEEGLDYRIVDILIRNPLKETINEFTVQYLKCDVLNQINNIDGTSIISVKVYDAERYIDTYAIIKVNATTTDGISYDHDFNPLGSALLELHMKKPIYTIEDWFEIKDSPMENYILKNDLDFGKTDALLDITFSGELDGDNHTIKEIESDQRGILIETLTGTISNLFVENATGNNSYNADENGLIAEAISATIKNVHVKNEEIKLTVSAGGIVGRADTSTLIENSSVSNLKILEVTSINSITLGGIAGSINSGIIRNCFVQNINFDIRKSDSFYGVGGIVGNAVNSNIINVYSTGSINTLFPNVGGIVGKMQGTIQNAYSTVNIITTQNYYGGIVGNITNDNISNTLSLGDIFSSTDTSTHRTVGNDNKVLFNRSLYALKTQKIHGYINETSFGETLVTREQIYDINSYGPLINLGDKFDYSYVSNKILPKLRYYESNEILPNQEEGNSLVSIEDEPITVNNILISKESDHGSIQIIFDNINPDRYQIDNIEIENIKDFTPETLKINNKSGDNQSTVIAILFPKQYLSSYMLSKIKYSDKETLSKKEINTTIKIDLEFFRQINEMDDFLSIDTNYLENYSINTDLDFSTVSEEIIKRGIKANKIEGNNHTISNYSYGTQEDETYIFNEVTTYMKNLNFDNINFYVDSWVKHVGVIGTGYGTIENVNINEFNIIPRRGKASYSGFVTTSYVNLYKNINITNSSIDGHMWLGTLYGSGDTYDLSNITLDNIEVKGTSVFVGGLVGKKESSNKMTHYNINANNIHVESPNGNYVGGLYGQGSATNVTLTNSSVSGNQYVGGIGGLSDFISVEENKLENVTIDGIANYIGGLYGYSTTLKNSTLKDITINGGTMYIGGISGRNGYAFNNIIDNATINSPDADCVSGYVGLQTNSDIDYSLVYNSRITGNNYTGGLVGCKEGDIITNLRGNIINANVTSKNDGAGGLIGYYNNLLESNNQGKISALNNLILNNSIEAKTNAGGMIGRMEKETTGSANLFHHNYIAANVKKISPSGSYGILVGTDDSYIASNHDNYIYDKSSLNSSYASDTQLSLLGNGGQFVSSSQIRDKNTFKTFMDGVWYYKYDDIDLGFYPSNQYITNSTNYRVSLPALNDNGNPFNVQGQSRYKNALNIKEELPTIYVYPSSINTFNIDFSSLGSTLKIGDRVFSVDKYTYTFIYDYKEDIKFTIYNNYYSKDYTIDKSSLIRTLYTKDNDYCYLNNNNLLCNNNLDIPGKYIHIFGNKALTEDGSIYDLTNNTIKSTTISNYYLTDTIPLMEKNLNYNNIKTFATYSMIDNKKIDNQIFIRNSNMGMTSNNLNNNKDMVIFDSYNNKKVLLVLVDDKIYSLMDDANIPYNLKNQDIVEISNNLFNNTDIVLIKYSNGNIAGFNYKTGKLLNITNTVSDDTSLISFFKDYINDSNSNKEIISYASEYHNTKSFIDNIVSENLISHELLLPQTSLTVIDDYGETTMNNEQITNNDFVATYNPLKEEYELYNIGYMMKSNTKQQEANTSINDLLNKNYQLSIKDINNYKSDIKIKTYNGKYIILVTSIIISIFLVLLGFIIKKISNNPKLLNKA